MCDTFLHPRPNFSTFLRSGANGTPHEAAHNAKRFKIEQSSRLLRREPVESEERKSEYPSFHPIYTPLIDNISGTISSAIDRSLTGEHSKTSSGGFAKFYDDCNINKPPHRTHPSLNAKQTFSRSKTAPGRIIEFPSSHTKMLCSAEETSEDLIRRHKSLGCQLVPKISATLPATQTERDALEIKSRYTSVSHRAMEEIPWRMKTTPKVRKQSRETRPDQVKQQVQRYETKSHAWQAVGPSFDRASPRKHTFFSKPIVYISESRQTRYTPGYTGGVPLVTGELGLSDGAFLKRTEIRRDLPPATAVSRKANIAGYTGYVRPGTSKRVHYLKPASTQALTHIEMPASARRQGAMYPRVNPVSNLVTLTHPYNPYNTINPTIRQRA